MFVYLLKLNIFATAVPIFFKPVLILRNLIKEGRGDSLFNATIQVGQLINTSIKKFSKKKKIPQDFSYKALFYIAPKQGSFRSLPFCTCQNSYLKHATLVHKIR